MAAATDVSPFGLMRAWRKILSLSLFQPGSGRVKCLVRQDAGDGTGPLVVAVVTSLITQRPRGPVDSVFFHARRPVRAR